MSLKLAHNRDQALLTMVIEEASDVARQQKACLGRTAVQKLTYFLQTVEVPMSYRFDIHHYGPYCYEVTRDIEWLLADRVVCDQSSQQDRYSDYAPAERAKELLELYSDSLDPYRLKVRKVASALVGLESKQMELMATLDYLYRQVKASGDPGPWKEQVIAKFVEIKGSKFPVAAVDNVYNVMVETGLFET